MQAMQAMLTNAQIHFDVSFRLRYVGQLWVLCFGSSSFGSQVQTGFGGTEVWAGFSDGAWGPHKASIEKGMLNTNT